MAILFALALCPLAQATSGARVVVRFKHSASAAERDVLLRAVRPVERVGGAYVLEVASDAAGQRLVERLRRRRAVAWTELSRTVRAAFVPNDPGTIGGVRAASGWQAVQWSLTSPFGINAPQAWSQASSSGGSGGRGIKIAVLDSGVSHAANGPFRASRDVPRARFFGGRDFVYDDVRVPDYYGHGTAVTHIIAAAANNDYGTVGVAYRARIMPVKVLDDSGSGDEVVVAQAIRYAAARRVDIINLSLELVTRTGKPRSLTRSRTMREALRIARRHGVTVVAATGNEFSPHVPARKYSSLAINVGGTTEHGCVGTYSSHGPGIDVVAPGGGSDAELIGDPNCRPAEAAGRDIAAVGFRAHTPGRFEVVGDYAGTSMAVPHVTGVVALVIASGVLGDAPTPDQIKRHLKSTARDLGAIGHDGYYGAGLVDAAAATARPPSPPPAVTPSG